MYALSENKNILKSKKCTPKTMKNDKH